MGFKNLPKIPHHEVMKSEGDLSFEASIGSLLRTQNAWLTPEGKIFACQSYRHLESLLELPLDDGLKEWIGILDILKNKSQEDRWQFEENLDPDEHHGWHHYYSEAESQASHEPSKIISYLYQNGWVRLGFLRKKEIEAEGCPSFLQEHKKTLNDIALMIKRDLMLTKTSLMLNFAPIERSFNFLKEHYPDKMATISRKDIVANHYFLLPLDRYDGKFEKTIPQRLISHIIWEFEGNTSSRRQHHFKISNPDQGIFYKDIPQDIMESIMSSWQLKIPTIKEFNELLTKCEISYLKIDPSQKKLKI